MDNFDPYNVFWLLLQIYPQRLFKPAVCGPGSHISWQMYQNVILRKKYVIILKVYTPNITLISQLGTK